MRHRFLARFLNAAALCFCLLCPLAWAQISLVRVTTCGPGQFPATTCTIPATGTGNLIVVGFASNPGSTPTISGVSDNANNNYVQAGNARAIDTSANEIVDIWYAKDSRPGATSITVTPNPLGTTGAAVIWEFANVDRNAPLGQTSTLNSQPATTSPVGASVTTASPPEVIVSVMSPSGQLAGLRAGNPFVSDSLLFGVGWAHLIANTAGTYAPQWDASSSTYAASTASFKAATSSGTSACDLNQDSAVNVVDGQLAVNMYLGLIPCTANIAGPGVCTSEVVQRVMNAVQGQACVVTTPPPPPPPVHLVTLNWTASASPSVAGYNVYRGTANGGPYTKINTSLVTGTTFTDNAVSAGQTYYYVATTVNTSSQESGYSNQAQAVVPSP